MIITDVSGAPGLEADRELVNRTGAAEQVAAILRARITEGYFPPGERLSEKDIGEQLRISRNTLREAFRLLTHEGLLTHEHNRGVSVRMPSRDDVIDLYLVRTVIECDAVRAVTAPIPADSDAAKAVAAGMAAQREERWQDLGTANMHFHRAVVALRGSPRLDDLMRAIAAELRLVFNVMDDPREFHERYLPRNRHILDALEAGDGAGAERLLVDYLDDAKRQLVAAYPG